MKNPFKHAHSKHGSRNGKLRKTSKTPNGSIEHACCFKHVFLGICSSQRKSAHCKNASFFSKKMGSIICAFFLPLAARSKKHNGPRCPFSVGFWRSENGLHGAHFGIGTCVVDVNGVGCPCGVSWSTAVSLSGTNRSLSVTVRQSSFWRQRKAKHCPFSRTSNGC